MAKKKKRLGLRDCKNLFNSYFSHILIFRVRTKFTVVDPASTDSNVKSHKHKTGTRDSRNTVSGKAFNGRSNKDSIMVHGPVTPLPPPLVWLSTETKSLSSFESLSKYHYCY